MFGLVAAIKALHKSQPAKIFRVPTSHADFTIKDALISNRCGKTRQLYFSKFHSVDLQGVCELMSCFIS